MSIRGIDTQMMIARATEVVRETSSLQRHPETTQEHIAAQTKTDSSLDQSRVAATTEAEMENIRTDVDGRGSGAAGGGGTDQNEEEMTEEQRAELLVAPGNDVHLIDTWI